MPTFKKFPWVSLALLLVTYSTLGWLLSAFNDSWLVWVITIFGVLLLAKAVSSPWSRIRDSFASLFKSDSRTFLVAVATALLTVVFITWLHIFTHALVVISAGILAKLDTQISGLNDQQAFWISLIVSLIGLGLGAAAQTITGAEILAFG